MSRREPAHPQMVAALTALKWLAMGAWVWFMLEGFGVHWLSLLKWIGLMSLAMLLVIATCIGFVCLWNWAVYGDPWHWLEE